MASSSESADSVASDPNPSAKKVSMDTRHVTISNDLPHLQFQRHNFQADGRRSRSSSRSPSPSPPASPEVSAAGRRRLRTLSGSNTEHLISTTSGRKIYTKGRPPWFNVEGRQAQRPYLIGICGGSASGKTTVAARIIERLDLPWVTILSMDSFYKVLNEEQHHQAAHSNYNFDHPDAFDLDLLEETLSRLREGKSVEVPVYDFTSHSRDPHNSKLMYGADVVIFEGILAFHRREIADMMDMKVFVDTDGDTRLTRRLIRDVSERGRDVNGVIDQYLRFVKPAYDLFIAPGTKVADIIVPRGGENVVAIDLIAKKVKQQLAERGYEAAAAFSAAGATSAWSRSQLAARPRNFTSRPPSLKVIEQTPQVRGLHTYIRDRRTKRDDVTFYSDRLMRILFETAMNELRYDQCEVENAQGNKVPGLQKTEAVCGVSIMRAGETMENALRGVVKDCKIGKILIQTNEKTQEPELYFRRLPKDVHKYRVILMDATVATGAAAMMAIRVLLDHDVREDNIILASLLMAEKGVHSVAYAFPKVRLLTTAVDPELSRDFHVLPGVGNFGDRYYGTSLSISGDEAENEEPL